MNSRQGIVKKKQETIFEISIDSLNYSKIHLKMRFRFAPIFSLVFSITAFAQKNLFERSLKRFLLDAISKPPIRWFEPFAKR
jgi:hypothetical protein